MLLVNGSELNTELKHTMLEHMVIKHGVFRENRFGTPADVLLEHQDKTF